MLPRIEYQELKSMKTRVIRQIQSPLGGKKNISVWILKLEEENTTHTREVQLIVMDKRDQIKKNEGRRERGGDIKDSDHVYTTIYRDTSE